MAIDPIPEGPRITPYLLYEDVGKALDWLAKAFGLEEFGDRFTGPDGKVSHAAMKLGNGQIMLGCPGATYKNPKRLGHATQHLYVYTDEVDALFARARSMGAAVIEEPKDDLLRRPPLRRRGPGRTSVVLRAARARRVARGARARGREVTRLSFRASSGSRRLDR